MVQGSRVGLLVLVGVFLIPLGLSQLRGLTHVLACADEVGTPFTLIVPDDGAPPVMLSAATIERGADPTLCGGLRVDLSAADVGDGRIEIAVPITNDTEHPWRGTVRLALGRQTIPLDYGVVDAGETAVDAITLRLSPGDHELGGELLIGP